MKTFLITILLSLTVSACTQPAEDPKAIADQYWHHLQTGNTVEAEKLVSTNSRHLFSDQKNNLASIDQMQNSDAITIVETTITTIDPKNKYNHTQTFNTILVLQQGQWRVDVNRSQLPLSPGAKEEEMQQLADELSESMQENIESIDEAMNQGMDMLNEALRDSSKEMGDSLLHLLNELNSSMKESIDKMKQRRQQQLQEKQKQPQQPQPDPDKGEGMI